MLPSESMVFILRIVRWLRLISHLKLRGRYIVVATVWLENWVQCYKFLSPATYDMYQREMMDEGRELLARVDYYYFQQ
jgi:hypothetical protein